MSRVTAWLIVKALSRIRLPDLRWIVASAATGWYGHESSILKFVFIHSITLASLVGVLVMLQAYVWPFSAMVVQMP